MANYYTNFSCVFDVGTSENAARALGIRGELAERLDAEEGATIGFSMAHDHQSGAGALWLWSDDGAGYPEHVIAFVLLCAEAFNLQGRWGFCWALSCSRPRLDGFGGGAQTVDLGRRESLEWVDCHHWVAAQMAPDADGDIATHPEAAAGQGSAP